MKYIIITLIYLALVILATIVPNPVPGQGANYFLHFVEFFIFASLIYLTAKQYNKKNPYVIAILVASLLAIFTELLQVFISFRTFNPLDSLSGILGSFLILIFKIRSRKGVWVRL